MGKKVNLVGQTFSDLKVIAFNGMSSDKMSRVWDCLCVCGNAVLVTTKLLRNGKVQSCGCKARRVLIKRNTTHGESRTPFYLVWSAMHSRCYNKQNQAYPRYGGRGIEVCERWHDFSKFKEDVGVRPKGHTLEREENNKGYSPDNVKWSTYANQGINKRNNVWVEMPDGSKECITRAAIKLKANDSTFRKYLLKYGTFLGARYVGKAS